MPAKLIFRILITIGIINTLIIITAALTGQNTYVLASSFSEYYDTVLCIIPLSLTGIALLWWLIDLRLKPTQRVNYAALAFTAIMPDAVFVTGSWLFATGP